MPKVSRQRRQKNTRPVIPGTSRIIFDNIQPVQYSPILHPLDENHFVPDIHLPSITFSKPETPDTFAMKAASGRRKTTALSLDPVAPLPHGDAQIHWQTNATLIMEATSATTTQWQFTPTNDFSDQILYVEPTSYAPYLLHLG